MKVLIVPKGVNPYQELLSSNPELVIQDEFRYVVAARWKFLYPLIFLSAQPPGLQCDPCRWSIFMIRFRVPWAKRLSYYYTKACFGVPRLFGCRIVWTVHEVTPNWTATHNDAGMARWMSRGPAAAKIAHSESSVQEMRDREWMSVERSSYPTATT